MTSTALLIFEKDEADRVISSLELFGNRFDEVVVIDSSAEREYDKLMKAATPAAQVYHVPPLGYPDLFRLYALTKVRSDYVLLLDADESISKELEAELPRLNKCDGYWVPRVEKPGRRISFHMRLFRKESYVFDGYIHGSVGINGKTGRLPKSHCLIHHLEPEHLKRRQGRYLNIELFEHPEPASVGRLLQGRNMGALPPLVFPLYLLRDFSLALRSALSGSSGYGLTESLAYAVAKYFHVYSQPHDRLKLAVGIARQMRLVGGPIKYLGLDNPQVVESLERYSKQVGLSGVDLFIGLLVSRYRDQSINDPLHPNSIGLSRAPDTSKSVRAAQKVI